MGILSSINRCLNSIPRDIIDENTIYIEVDRDSYDLLQTEIKDVTGALDLRFIEQKVEQFGTCSVFAFNEYKIVVALDRSKGASTNFYVAFKTKIYDSVVS